MHEKHSTLAVLFQPIHFPPLKATRLSCLRGILEPSLIFLEENRSHSRRAISAGESRSGKLYGLVRITTDKSSSRFCSLSLSLSLSLVLSFSPLPDHFCELTANEWSGGVVQVGFQPCIPFNRTNGLKLFPRLTRIREVCWKLYPFWRQPPWYLFSTGESKLGREGALDDCPCWRFLEIKIGQEVCSRNYISSFSSLYFRRQLWFFFEIFPWIYIKVFNLE